MFGKKKPEQKFDPGAPARPDTGIFGMTTKAEDCLVHLIPVPFEATTSYRQGTARGPSAIVEASHQLDLFDLDCGRPYESGIIMLPESPEIRELNEEAVAHRLVLSNESSDKYPARRAINLAGEKVNAIVSKTAKSALKKKKLVGLVGGDHASPFGLIEILSRQYPGMGILHIDAHHDLRDSYEGFSWSHASIMFNVATQLDSIKKIVQVGIRDFSEKEKELVEESKDLMVSFYDQDMKRERFKGWTFASQAKKIVDELPQDVYISFDIDGLDPKLCPNTGTPVPGGLDFDEVNFLIREVATSGRRIVGFDLCEVAPGADEWDANVGARILYKLIGNMISSQQS